MLIYKYKVNQIKIMSIFRRHNITFNKQDPLDNGLSDDIAAERHEADAFGSMDDISGDELAEQWNVIVKDIEKDQLVQL